jgi:hypothetical protein
MEDSTKTILILAGLGAAGYLVYRAVKAQPLANAALAFSDLSAEDLEGKAEELTKVVVDQTKKAAEAVAAGDKSAALAAEAAVAVAKAEVRVVSAAVLANRKKTAEYGTDNVKNYQKVINAVVKAMDGSFKSFRQDAGIYSLTTDGKWGPKTKVASDAFIALCQAAANQIYLDAAISANQDKGLLPFITKSEEISQTPDSAGVISLASTEKAFVINSASLLSIPISSAETELMAVAVGSQSPNA